jgi:hypothetical protein
MPTFQEQLKKLTVPQLRKLEKILLHLDCNPNCDFDELLERLASKQPLPTKAHAELIGARTYELEIYDGLDSATAHAQALEEFNSGKLRVQIKRHRSKGKSKPATPAVASVPAGKPASANNLACNAQHSR